MIVEQERQELKDYQVDDGMIFELTGRKPDERWFVPHGEKCALVADAQAQAPKALDTLISQHLRYVYKNYVLVEEIRERPDLDAAEVMDIGYLAIIESVMRANPESPDLSTELARDIGGFMDKLLMETKLLPSISDTENPVASRMVYRPRNNADFVDAVDPIDPHNINETLRSQDRSQALESIENEAWPELARKFLANLIEKLSQPEARAISLLFGLDGEGERTHAEIAKLLNVSSGKADKIKYQAEEKLRALGATPGASLCREPGVFDENTNMGLLRDPVLALQKWVAEAAQQYKEVDEAMAIAQSRRPGAERPSTKATSRSDPIQPEPSLARRVWTPEQTAKQAAWLREIAAKKEH